MRRLTLWRCGRGGPRPGRPLRTVRPSLLMVLRTVLVVLRTVRSSLRHGRRPARSGPLLAGRGGPRAGRTGRVRRGETAEHPLRLS
ncbi:hypothetical protein [Actinoalloteichus fjordicus]|uniref:hypothetical protein n=1 Tax=Actinoalloteichus fjordicus TaxID=1612552 RepID=UPI000950FD51|nr:hypothetical protein [Actinoalloteichus fjordicus]